MIFAAASILMAACASDSPEQDEGPGGTTVEAPAFDPSVDPGVGTETDEGNNLGFEDDEPSGNATNINGG